VEKQYHDEKMKLVKNKVILIFFEKLESKERKFELSCSNIIFLYLYD
jgi:hypothetical protein